MPKRVVPEGPGRRVPVMSRTTVEMREKLEAAAAQSGRSLGQEVEARLEASFATDRVAEVVADRMQGHTLSTVIDEFGGEVDFPSALAVAHAFQTFRDDWGMEWTDPAVRQMFLDYMAAFLPKLAANPPKLPASRRVSQISGAILLAVVDMLPPAPELTNEQEAARSAAYDQAVADGRLIGEREAATWVPVDEEADARRRIIREATEAGPARKPRRSRKA